MDFSTLILLCSAVYSLLFFFDVFFKSCAHHPYLQLLKGTGLDIGFFRLRWRTTFFNRLILRLGASHSRFFNLWFNSGLFVALALLPIAVGFLLYASYQIACRIVSSNDRQLHNEEIVMQAGIPGLNLPVSDIGYYVITLVVCTVVHELGHALAAVREDVHLIDFGICIFFLLPSAFVNISTDKLVSLNQWKTLKIQCAGIWHNVVLAAFAFTLLKVLPLFFSVFFVLNNGVIVTSLTGDSPLKGYNGLSPGQVVQGINECHVHDLHTWHECLSNVLNSKVGYCISADDIHELDESVPLLHLPDGAVDCCGSNKEKNICFEYVDRQDGVLEILPHMCLPTRKALEKSLHFCSGIKDLDCPSSLHCVRPLMSNNSHLMKVWVKHANDVIFIGHPADLYLTVRTSPHIPKFVISSFIPDATVKMLNYIVVFSFGFAVLNALPCLFLDGQHICYSLVKILFARNSLPNEKNAALIVTVLGTVALFINLFYTLWTLVANPVEQIK